MRDSFFGLHINPTIHCAPFPGLRGAPSFCSGGRDPILSLRVHRPDTNRDALDDEALGLMQILRDCVFKTSELTGFLAGHREVFAGHQYDVSMLDATATFRAPQQRGDDGVDEGAQHLLSKVELKIRREGTTEDRIDSETSVRKGQSELSQAWFRGTTSEPVVAASTSRAS